MFSLDRMCSLKVAPTTELFNVLMDICAKSAISGAGQPQDGFGILQWMSSFAIEPDRTTYNTLLNLLAQSARCGTVNRPLLLMSRSLLPDTQASVDA